MGTEAIYVNGDETHSQRTVFQEENAMRNAINHKGRSNQTTQRTTAPVPTYSLCMIVLDAAIMNASLLSDKSDSSWHFNYTKSYAVPPSCHFEIRVCLLLYSVINGALLKPIDRRVKAASRLSALHSKNALNCILDIACQPCRLEPNQPVVRPQLGFFSRNSVSCSTVKQYRDYANDVGDLRRVGSPLVENYDSSLNQNECLEDRWRDAIGILSALSAPRRKILFRRARVAI
eukprot:IDg17094t1